MKTNLGYGVYKQVDARISSEIIDISFIQENTLVSFFILLLLFFFLSLLYFFFLLFSLFNFDITKKFYIKKHGPLSKEMLSAQSEDVFSVCFNSFFSFPLLFLLLLWLFTNGCLVFRRCIIYV